MGGTTNINAPLVPVSVDLLQSADPNSAVRFHVDATQFISPILNSPIFQNVKYSSGDTPTQYEDAVQRAEYLNRGKADWHTLLVPSVKTARTIRVPRGQYLAFGNAHGTCCLGIVVAFNAF